MGPFACLVIWLVTVTPLSPFAGGLLARPCDRWPDLFVNSFWKDIEGSLGCEGMERREGRRGKGESKKERMCTRTIRGERLKLLNLRLFFLYGEVSLYTFRYLRASWL